MTNLHTISHQRDMAWTIFLSLSLFAGMMLLPSLALASSGSTTSGRLEEVLCRLVEWMTGTTGKAIATLAIIIIGVGALMGKVSWGMAIIVGIGVAVIFGAEQIVEDLGGTGSCDGF